jgi:hypothetical protein
MKVQGPNVDSIQQLASQIQTVLSGLPQMSSVFSEKVAQLAVGISRKWLWATDAQLLVGEFRVQQRRHLRRHLPRGARSMIGCGDLWVVCLSLSHELGQK